MADINLARWAGDLARPAPLLATATLVVNDHMLKGSGLVPGAVTGKLSDVAGLFVAGLLAVCVTRRAGYAASGRLPARTGRAALVALAAVAAAFSALKLWPDFNHAVAAAWGHNMLDPTDLYALPALLLAWLWLRDREAHDAGGAGRQFATGVALIGVVLACAATPAPPPVPPRPVAGWVASDATRATACGTATARVSKSGKTGFGLTLRVTENSGAPCPVTIAAANVRFPGEQPIAGREIALDQPDLAALRERRAQQYDAQQRPPEWTRYHYLAFEFDNNTRWNRGQREAVIEIDLVVDGKPVTWAMSARHQYVTYPVGGYR